MQLNGVNIAAKFGMDFNTQYSVPDTGLTNNTTIANSPTYNLNQVKFDGKQTDRLPEFANSNLFQRPTTGLKTNLNQGEHKLFTSI